jgi:hypothetical protein
VIHKNISLYGGSTRTLLLSKNKFHGCRAKPGPALQTARQRTTTELCCNVSGTLLSYDVSYWAAVLLVTLHPPSAKLHSTEQCCILLSFAALLLSYTVNSELRYTIFSQAAPSRLRCILLSYAAPCWATLHPAELHYTLCATLHPCELHCTLVSYAASNWAMMHSSELRCILLSYPAPSELGCTLLS